MYKGQGRIQRKLTNLTELFREVAGTKVMIRRSAIRRTGVAPISFCFSHLVGFDFGLLLVLCFDL